MTQNLGKDTRDHAPNLTERNPVTREGISFPMSPSKLLAGYRSPDSYAQSTMPHAKLGVTQNPTKPHSTERA